MDLNEIEETIKDANIYLKRLQNLYTEIDYAEQQIRVTATEAENNVKIAFTNILSAITSSLCCRRDKLINKIKTIQEQGLLPLNECRKIVLNKVQRTTSLITLGEDLLKPDNNNKSIVLNDFSKRSSLLGSLPEVPPLKEVPYISFQYDIISEKNLLNICNNFGCVVHTAPVQISALSEKPGAILVEWTNSELYDHVLDIQEYRLQKAFGKHIEENFRTCYSGPDTQYLAKDLLLNQDYTFRICCKFEGEAAWSPWSLSQVGRTTVQPFSWSDNKNFVITNDNKIATPLKDESSILFSNKIDFSVGYSVEFVFLECDDNNLDGTCVGLFALDDLKELQLTDLDSVYVEANGSIYESGSKKSTKFSPVTKGTKICFSCDLKSHNKIRINIDCSGKRVTYYWSIDNHAVYLGAKFNSSKWKIMID